MFDVVHGDNITLVEADEYEVDEGGDLVFWMVDEDDVDEDTGEAFMVEVHRFQEYSWSGVMTVFEHEDKDKDAVQDALDVLEAHFENHGGARVALAVLQEVHDSAK